MKITAVQQIVRTYLRRGGELSSGSSPVYPRTEKGGGISKINRPVLYYLALWGSQSWLQPPFEAALRSTGETDRVIAKPRPLSPQGGRLKSGCSQDWLPHVGLKRVGARRGIPHARGSSGYTLSDGRSRIH